MTFDIRMPQLVEMQTLDELYDHVDALHQKIDDALAQRVGVSPAASEVPAETKPKRTRKAAAPTALAPATPAVSQTNGEDTDVEDEDALRARCEFEAKRVQRLIGIGGMRAALSRVADGVLHIDDVPAARLASVLTALQAL